VTAESWRVAQIVVECGPGDQGWRGSGYLVAPGRVLTAAHVVAGARVVRVRMDVGQRTKVDIPAERWWADPAGSTGTDLAVVMIPGDATAGREVEPARFGRIGDCMAVLAVQAFGFPQFKLRASSEGQGESGVFRDFEQVTGHAPVAANRRQGTLAVYLDDPPPAPPEPGNPSPWAGMSGAAVWAADRIVGVVAEHHPGEGTGRLTARRLDRAYEQLPEPDLGRLVGWLGLAPAIGGLPDVVPAGPGRLVRSAYLAQVRDIGPDELIGRDGELAEWAEFCAGPGTYAWWQAGPWAGKSALASWFVTHPPAGVDIISFFITGRLVGQADSDAFLDAMIEQLNALAPLGGGSPATARARVGTWLSLLASVAAQAEERGRRLVVVVDGLDEDDAGARPPRGRPSIASLLPRRPTSGTRFVVTSRPDPGLPDDVPSGHPLRTCLPRELPVSWVAEDLAMRAKQELRDLLSGDQTAIDIVGYIAGSGGGLARSDLSALTGAPPLKLDPILRGVFGRSLQTRAFTDSRDADADPAARVYLFAHETLRVTAEQQLGAELARYRQGIHDWIDSYANLDWPDTTPGYAIRGYPRLLIATSDATRLSALARDPRRHVFLLRATGSDYAAEAEIATAQRLVAGQDEPDLQALLELAVYRNGMSIRNQCLPFALPGAWVRLGRLDHGEALARTITQPDARAAALEDVATAAAQAGDPDRAEAVALSIAEPLYQVWALAELETATAQAGDPDRASRLAAEAEALAETIADPNHRGQALDALASAAAQAGDLDRAEGLARSMTIAFQQARTLTELAGLAAGAGDPDRAEAVARSIADADDLAWALAELASAAARAGDADRAARLATEAEALARTITDPEDHAQVLGELAKAAAQTGDPDRAARLAAEAGTLAQTITSDRDRARTLDELATALAQAGDPDRAETVARTITSSGQQARTLGELASTAARAGDPDRAARLAAESEALAGTITDPEDLTWVLTGLAAAAAEADDPDRAEALARAIPDPDFQVEVLGRLARTAVDAGDPDRALRLAAEAEAAARTINIPYYQARALEELAKAAVRTGDLDCAEALARAITRQQERSGTLDDLAIAAAEAGDVGRAARLAADAEALAHSLPDAYSQANMLAALVSGGAEAGDPNRASRLATEAEAIARTITDPRDQASVLADLAAAIAKAGDLDRAETLARTITSPKYLVRALTEMAEAVAEAGDADRADRLAIDAEAMARTITDPDDQAQALARLASVAAGADDPDGTDRLAIEADDPDGADRLVGAADWTGDAERVGRLVSEAEVLARGMTDSRLQVWVLAELATAAGQADDPDRAEGLARAITGLNGQSHTLAQLASAAAKAGDADRASRLFTEAETLARTITKPEDRDRALADVAIALVRADDLDRTEALARAIDDPDAQQQALAELASAIAQAGDLDRARDLFALALSADSPEIIWWIEALSQSFPDVIAGARTMFLGAYTAEP